MVPATPGKRGRPAQGTIVYRHRHRHPPVRLPVPLQMTVWDGRAAQKVNQ